MMNWTEDQLKQLWENKPEKAKKLYRNYDQWKEVFEDYLEARK